MKRLVLALVLVATTTVLAAADPLDGVREAAAGWRAGAVKQDAAGDRGAGPHEPSGSSP